MPVVAKPLFDETRLAGLVTRWQEAIEDERPQIWQEIVEQAIEFLYAVIRSNRVDLRALGSHQEICSELVLKLHRVLSKYRPGRGRLFSLLERSLQNHCCTLLQKHYRYTLRYQVNSDFVDAHDPHVTPEVYSLAAEIRARLEHYTAPNGDFEWMIIRQVLVFGFTGEGAGGPGASGLPDRVSAIVAKLCKLSPEAARARTLQAVECLRDSLKDLRGRPAQARVNDDTSCAKTTKLSPRLAAYRDELAIYLNR
jgi:DNA-directed RNA polymerase specialized sigma24 family protein